MKIASKNCLLWNWRCQKKLLYHCLFWNCLFYIIAYYGII